MLKKNLKMSLFILTYGVNIKYVVYKTFIANLKGKNKNLNKCLIQEGMRELIFISNVMSKIDIIES